MVQVPLFLDTVNFTNHVRLTITTGGIMNGIVNIKGKDYKTVAKRVEEFREKYPRFSLINEIVQIDEKVVIIKSTISDETGRILSTGFAEEKRGSSMINKTSALENAETSAIGRALSGLGFGGTEFASANEVENAIHQQSKDTTNEVAQARKKQIAETHARQF